MSAAPLPDIMIDERVVLKQKIKALKELESRVNLATAKHNHMYKIQREHIAQEHKRQHQVAISSIQDEKEGAILAL